MKRILLSLMMVVGLLSATAAETVLNTSEMTWNGSGTPTMTSTANGFTITIKKESGLTAPLFHSSGEVRVYAKGTITIASGNGVMNSVALAIPIPYGTDLMGANTVNVGSIVNDPTTGLVTWTGSADSFTITVADKATLGKDPSKNSQFRFTNLTLITGAATAVADPLYTPRAGKFYEAQDVTIECATEGAKIYYTTDGTTPTAASTEYTTPIRVEKIGDTVIKSIGVKAGLDNSAVSEGKFTIADPASVANITAFLASNTTGTATGEVLTIDSPVTVTYQGVTPAGTYLFVQDATGALLIYAKGSQPAEMAYATGDVIPAGIAGSVDFYGKAPQMLPMLESFAPKSGTAEVKPIVCAVEDIASDMVNKMVQIKNATVSTDGKTITDETGSIAMYSRFPSVITPTDGEKYTINAMVNLYNEKIQLYPTNFDNGSGVNDAVVGTTTIVANIGNINITVADAASAVIYNAAGQVVANQAIVAGENTIDLANGFYIVKVGSTVAKVIVK